jgi:cytochrome c-type biogenesis protein CcmH
MKEMIAIQLAEGQDLESIKAYFVEQYGPQVLGEPPRSGFNWLAWILPVVAVVVGGVFFWRMTHRMVQPDAQPVASTPQRGGTSEEDYARKLEEELAKYG